LHIVDGRLGREVFIYGDVRLRHCHILSGRHKDPGFVGRETDNFRVFQHIAFQAQVQPAFNKEFREVGFGRHGQFSVD